MSRLEVALAYTPTLFTTCDLLPTQLAPSATLGQRGHRVLRVAVFELAWKDLRRPHRASCTRHHPQSRCHTCNARAWFASAEEQWPLSFVAICRAFHLDPAAVRHAVATQLGEGAPDDTA